ncbi:hypothetical protein AHMF7605_10570 [Adhaeribacter arboris]|uniref:Uncharacterized protein n=1 Tax=Adhaeribacter arboris TaxID=2072846 RepID=A0A2T2YEI7_9BACT|nr:hypothetical protein [Adhaeribacter arboris]PSR53930.1 hypothetical protein AHMF7605_10570 [Adhaeribacter arboris]
MNNQKETAEQWLIYAIENWKGELTRLRARDTDALFSSFKGNVIDQADSRLKIEIAYAWYGQMIDMGVGRGTRSGEQKAQATERRLIGKFTGNRRQAKKWYSGRNRNGIGYQVTRLGMLMEEIMVTAGIEKIKGSIDQKLVITF